MIKPDLTILLADPRGFCAGVDRAIEIVERALIKYGAPVYVRHEIVHNQHVLKDLRSKGAVFVKELDEVPENMPVIFSAHGVPKSVPRDAKNRKMLYIDATCPLVSKVHKEAEFHANQNHHIILIGHAGHPEVIGTMGQVDAHKITLVETVADVDTLTLSTSENIAYITQTTLSMDETADIITRLKQKYPHIIAPKKEDLCYATTNRQLAVKDLAEESDIVIVLGSKNSSNSNRLREVAIAYGARDAQLINHAEEIDWQGLIGKINTMGLTAGASAPDILVQGVIDKAQEFFKVTVQNRKIADENIAFNIPVILRDQKEVS